MSLYGFSQSVYKNFTGIDRFEDVLSGILRAKELGIETWVSLILHRDNVDQLKDMVTFCQENELRFAMSIEITDRYDGSSGMGLHQITDEQYIELITGEFKDYFAVDNRDHALQCSCARSIIGIGSNVDVYPCI